MQNSNIIEELKKEGLFLPNGRFNSSYVKKFSNSITPERKKWYDTVPGDSLSEKVYLIINDISVLPVCLQCGNKVSFISPGEGYREYCSSACRAKGNMKAIKQTNLRKYGVESPAQNKDVQAKMKATTQERYGVDNIFQRTDIIKNAFNSKYGVNNPMQVPEIQEKVKKKLYKIYGVHHPSKSPEIVKKRAITNLKRYGNTCSLHDKDIQQNIRLKLKKEYLKNLFAKERFKTRVEPLFTDEEYNGITGKDNKGILYKWKCIKCSHEFEDDLVSQKVPRCPICYPATIRGADEYEFVQWLKTIIDPKYLIFNTRRVIPPLELDIYIPHLNLAIEFNEVYWHSEIASKGVRDSNYHSNKTEECKKKDIHLIHILDTEWWNKREIVQSIVKAKLGLFDSRYFARKCEVREVSAADSQSFLEANHIQGSAQGTFRYGLYCHEELVSLLIISPNRFKRDTYEIVRFASKLNSSVIGGLSKLWKVAKVALPPNITLISYVDLRYFKGESNTKLGLTFQYNNKPGYHYTKDYKALFNRMNFQKKLLATKLEVYDPNLTEWENMQINKYDRIWDCGTAVYMIQY